MAKTKRSSKQDSKKVLNHISSIKRSLLYIVFGWLVLAVILQVILLSVAPQLTDGLSIYSGPRGSGVYTMSVDQLLFNGQVSIAFAITLSLFAYLFARRGMILAFFLSVFAASTVLYGWAAIVIGNGISMMLGVEPYLIPFLVAAVMALGLPVTYFLFSYARSLQRTN